MSLSYLWWWRFLSHCVLIVVTTDRLMTCYLLSRWAMMLTISHPPKGFQECQRRILIIAPTPSKYSHRLAHVWYGWLFWSFLVLLFMVIVHFFFVDGNCAFLLAMRKEKKIIWWFKNQDFIRLQNTCQGLCLSHIYQSWC